MNWNQILDIGTPMASAAIASAATFFIGKRKRNNDFLGEMQENIDMLVEKYSETLKELVAIKAQNAKLLDAQHELQSEVKKLRQQNGTLKTKVDKLNKKITEMKDFQTEKEQK